MTRARSVLLAALIVCSAVIGAAGPALAQSTETATDSGPVTKTFETGPHKVKIDLFDVSSETTITVITDESPAGNNTAILKKTVSGSQNSAHFRNAGAYESFTVKVEGADGPVSFSKGGPTAAWTPGDSGKFLGDTGGDPGFTYDLSEQIGESVMPQVVQLDRTGLPDSTTINTTGTDAQQTKLDIYQSAQNNQAQADNQLTTLENYLSDTKTQARIIGKNAYILALNNGSSKAAAKTQAKSAVSDYYAVKQRNLANTWTIQVEHFQYLRSVARSESGISQTSGNPPSMPSDFIYNNVSRLDSNDYVGVSSIGTQSVSTVNGTSITVTAVEYRAQDADNMDGDPEWATPAQSPKSVRQTYGGHLDGFMVSDPGNQGGPTKLMDFERYHSAWSEIQNQNTQVQNDMDTLAENTYSAYQSGEINSSDLVDPYVLANQQSAGEDFQGWTAAQLTLLGTNSPENFDQIGSFNITTESGTQYEGVLFSQENPASGQFENGTTYDTANIGGTQYVVTSDRIVELDGTFTIDRITTTSGETTENVTIQKTTYKTTNVTELKQQYEDLAYRRAQIEAREKALQQSAGGGLLGGGSVPPVVALAVIGTLLAVAVLQD
ncbi:hypothetical protein DVK00_05085 [Haloarcula sp. Atlit-47R]|uniref:hypothetical protein n=1 Tax=Haloarcula sp. Atlit-47R TaxID=2282132 RepID=UPI000EF25A8A|nr:hypothetical protein [Haloarcula sp. Atlit-47R]RLM47880.1 hypothetical protein DVK00_05085 [Haloarcula sp. Atlit-47R]